MLTLQTCRDIIDGPSRSYDRQMFLMSSTAIHERKPHNLITLIRRGNIMLDISYHLRAKAHTNITSY